MQSYATAGIGLEADDTLEGDRTDRFSGSAGCGTEGEIRGENCG